MADVADLLQVWLGLAGVAVVGLGGLLYAAHRLGWADVRESDSEPMAETTD